MTGSAHECAPPGHGSVQRISAIVPDGQQFIYGPLSATHIKESSLCQAQVWLTKQPAQPHLPS